MPRSVSHTGTPYKYQLTFDLQRAELVLSNPLGKLSFVFRVNNQRAESVQRPKALKDVPLNETITTIATLYELQSGAYEDTFVTIDLFLNQTKSAKIIGVAEINITEMLNLAERNDGEMSFSVVMEKSPEYKAKLSIKIATKCLGVEVIERPNFSKKRGHSNLPSKTIDLLDENKSDISENDEQEKIRMKTHQMSKNRSVTPTPGGSSLAKQTISYSEIVEKKKNPILIKPEPKKSEDGSDVEIINKNEEIKLEETRKKEAKLTTSVKNDRKKIEEKPVIKEKVEIPPPKIEKPETSQKNPKLDSQTKVENIEKITKTEKKEKDKQAYNLKTPPSRKEKLDNISTIQPLSETMNSTVENSVLQKDVEDFQPKRRDTFGFKSTGFEPENNNVLNSLIEDNDHNNKEQEDLRKLDTLQEENKQLLKEKVRLEGLLNEVRDVKKGLQKEQDAKMLNLGRENADLKEELQRKTREFDVLTVKSKEIASLLSEKEEEVNRLEDLTAGLQREILHLKSEMREKDVEGLNREQIDEMKSIIKQLEQDVEGRTVEKAEILKKKEEEFRELKKANEMLMENNTKLQQNLLAFSKENSSEKMGLKEDVKKLEEHRENLKKELMRKDGKILELEESLRNLQGKYVKTKEEVADIVNLVFEKGGLELMEEIEGYMVNLSEISKDLEAKLSEKR